MSSISILTVKHQWLNISVFDAHNYYLLLYPIISGMLISLPQSSDAYIHMIPHATMPCSFQHFESGRNFCFRLEKFFFFFLHSIGARIYSIFSIFTFC